jgi:hypothetical protein
MGASFSALSSQSYRAWILFLFRHVLVKPYLWLGMKSRKGLTMLSAKHMLNAKHKTFRSPS